MRVVWTCNRCPGGLTVRVNDRSRLGSLRVQADARGLVSRSGTALVAELAARLGVVGELSGALCDLHRRRPVHDPGAVLCDLATMLIDGGDCISDLGALADQPDLLGRVASHSTVSRLLHALGEDERGALRVARGSLAPYAALEAGARGGWVPARGCLGGRADRPGGSQRLAAGGAADLSQGAPPPRRSAALHRCRWPTATSASSPTSQGARSQSSSCATASTRASRTASRRRQSSGSGGCLPGA